MNHLKQVACLGELMLRLSPPGQELPFQSPQFRASFAGAEANVAVALSEFGHGARFFSVLPDNMVGKAAAKELRGFGVDTQFIRFVHGRMGVFYVTQGNGLRASEVLYDRTQSAFAEQPLSALPTSGLDGVEWLHLSGVTPALSDTCADAAIRAASMAVERDIPISFDGNYRSQLWAPRKERAPAILHSLIERATVLFGDERDIGLALGVSFDQHSLDVRRRAAVDAAFERFARLQQIAFTERMTHEIGAYDYAGRLYTRTSEFKSPGYGIPSPVDRIGAGDAFAAGVLHGIFRNWSNQATLQFGVAAGTLKHSIVGDFFTLSEADVLAASSSPRADVKR